MKWTLAALACGLAGVLWVGSIWRRARQQLSRQEPRASVSSAWLDERIRNRR